MFTLSSIGSSVLLFSLSVLFYCCHWDSFMLLPLCLLSFPFLSLFLLHGGFFFRHVRFLRPFFLFILLFFLSLPTLCISVPHLPNLLFYSLLTFPLFVLHCFRSHCSFFIVSFPNHYISAPAPPSSFFYSLFPFPLFTFVSFAFPRFPENFLAVFLVAISVHYCTKLPSLAMG